ncbi:MAG: hypothetical protein ACREJP_03045, partial [Candidatus Methylomirabilales bacterium]
PGAVIAQPGAVIAQPGAVIAQPGAVIALDMVNVFSESVIKTEVSPKEAGARPQEEICLSVKAWVSNIAYDKSVWVEVSLLNGKGAVVHSEQFTLDFAESAGGNGDFFALESAIPSTGSSARPRAPKTLQYKLFFQANGTIFTDGVLHTRDLAGLPGAKTAR